MNLFHLLNTESMSFTTILLLKVTAILMVAWLIQTMLRRSNPRWRILLWRCTAIGLVGVALFSLRAPMFSLPVLAPATLEVVSTAVTPKQPTHVVENRTASLRWTGLERGEQRQRLQSIQQGTTASSDKVLANRTPSDKTTDSSSESTIFPATSTHEFEEPVGASKSIQDSAQISWDLSVWVPRVWLVGALFCLGYLLMGIAHLAKLCRSSIAVPDWIETELTDQIAVNPEVGKVRVRQSDRIKAPCSVGLIRKTILLPVEMCGTGQAEELKAVFAHELAHFSGNDLRWNYVFFCLSIVLWFHPLVWRIRHAHADACDERCDAKAASQLGDSAGYIRQLARIALQVSGQTPTSALPMARSSNVTNRIQMLQQGIGQLSLRRWKAGLVVMAAAVLMLFIGVIGVSRSVAQKIKESPAVAKQSEQKNIVPAEQINENPRGFSGRTIDETGAPVTDATIELTSKHSDDRQEHRYSAKVDKDGRFLIEDIKRKDTYRIEIRSKQSVGITDWNQVPEIQLSPDSSLVRDFTLQRACNIRIRAVNEAGKPIPNVSINAALVSKVGRGVSQRGFRGGKTNKHGWATIRGLKPSKVEYIFGASSKDYGAAKILKVLDDPTAKVEEVLVLSPGKKVSGTVMCSDGKPAAGWRITASPTWSRSGNSSSAAEIAADGSFTLPNITGDNYDIFVRVPVGDGLSREEQVQSEVALADQQGPLELKLRVPSQKSLVSITGNITTTGPEMKRPLHIDARSENADFSGRGTYVPGEQSFRISSLPPGLYTLIFESPEVEEKIVANVRAPSDGLKVELNVIRQPRLVGKVVRADTKAPLSQFKIRVLKVKALRGRNYVQDSKWQTIDNDKGEFSVDVVGPGVYQIVASAENFAELRSQPINTDEYQGEPITLSINKWCHAQRCRHQ